MTNAEKLITSFRYQSPKGHARRPTALAQALALQQIIFQRCCDKKIRADHLASLARSWCGVQDCVRIIQGKPLPGQLRPDLDPDQAMKALRSIQAKLPREIAGASTAILDCPPPEPTATPPIDGTKGISFSRQGGGGREGVGRRTEAV